MFILVILSVWQTSKTFDFPCQAEVTIPENTTVVPNSAFEYCSSLTAVRFPTSLISIGDQAFNGCSSLLIIEIPHSVTTIGKRAFQDCAALTFVVIGDSVTTIGAYAFRYCLALNSVIFGKAVISIGEEAFYESSLSTLEIPYSVKSIGKAAFRSCPALTSVVIGDSVTTIGEDAFRFCSALNSVVLGKSVTEIGIKAFGNCLALTSVTFGDSVITIGQGAFAKCSAITSVVLSNSLTAVGDEAFAGCSSLTSVTIPDSVANLGQLVFYRCSSLTSHSVVLPTAITSTVALECNRFKSRDGATYYHNPEAGTPMCKQCPEFTDNALQFVLVCLMMIVGLLCFICLGYSSAAPNRDSKAIQFIAACSLMVSTVQIVQLTAVDVPWPPSIAAVTRVLDFMTLRIHLARPECSFPMSAATRIELERRTVLFAVPGLLLFMYGITLTRKGFATCSLTSAVIKHIRKCAIATIANLHWMSLVLLWNAWRPFACDWYLTKHEGFVWNREPTLLEDANVRCSLDDPGWAKMLPSAILGLFLFQVALPLYMIKSAHQPHMTFATSAYHDRWKRTWIIAELLQRTALALVKTFTTAEGQPRCVRFGLLQTRAAAILTILGIYLVVLLKCRPYSHEVIACTDAAPFYTILICEMTKISFAVAALLTLQSDGLRTEQHHALEVFLLIVLSMWTMVGFYLVSVYGPYRVRNCCRLDEGKVSRRDLGTFTPGARHAVISAPGAPERSWEVRLKIPDSTPRKAVLVHSFNGRELREPPMLKRGQIWAIRFEDSGCVEEVDTGDLEFAGEAEYEFWNSAINRSQSFERYSFACVWVPGIRGHCQPADTFQSWTRYRSHVYQKRYRQLLRQAQITQSIWDLYQSTLPWICANLAAGYGHLEKIPPCDNCGWFDYWAINVMRCYLDGQKLRFAYLALPLYDGQPEFYCTARGHEGFYYVGIAQKVELEWVQNQMHMIVTPISFVEDMLGTCVCVSPAPTMQERMVAEVLRGTPSSKSEVNRHLDAMQVNRKTAQRRRDFNRLLLMTVVIMACLLGGLSLEAGINDRGNSVCIIDYGRVGFRIVNIVIGCVLLLSVAIFIAKLNEFFHALGVAFNARDKKEDDEFYADIHRRLKATMASAGTSSNVTSFTRGSTTTTHQALTANRSPLTRETSPSQSTPVAPHMTARTSGGSFSVQLAASEKTEKTESLVTVEPSIVGHIESLMHTDLTI